MKINTRSSADARPPDSGLTQERVEVNLRQPYWLTPCLVGYLLHKTEPLPSQHVPRRWNHRGVAHVLPPPWPLECGSGGCHNDKKTAGSDNQPSVHKRVRTSGPFRLLG